MLAVVLVLALVGAFAVISRRPAGLHVASYGGPLPKMQTPSAYHITYTVTSPGKPTYTQEVFVRRPFDSVDEELTNGKLYLETVLRLGEQVFGTERSLASEVHTAMSPTRRDVRLDAVATDAIAAHRLKVVGKSTVLHETCYVVRSAAALDSGPLKPLDASSYVDSCVDRRGLVLYEATTRNGRRVTQRRAMHVATGRSAVAHADFALKGSVLPANRGGGGVRQLTFDSRADGPFWDVARAPAGFRHTGRYALVPSQPQAYDDPNNRGTNPLGLPGSLVASIDDVYVRGADAIVIEQGSTVNDAKFNPPADGIPVDLGPVLGRGQLVLSASASEVVAEPHEGRRFVRVVGTMPPQELIALARSMTLQPPGSERPL